MSENIRDYLLNRALNAVRQSDAAQPFVEFKRPTRRHFLTGSGIGGALALGQGQFQESPRIVVLGRKIAVHYRDCEWLIDPALFGSSATLRWQQLRTGFVIELENSKLPGTDLPVDFNAHIFERAGSWQIELSLPGLGFRATELLAEWISNRTPLKSVTSVHHFQLANHRVELGGNRIPMNFSPDFVLRIGDEDSRIEISSPFSYTGNLLLLRQQNAPHSEFRSIADDDHPGASTFFRLTNPVSAGLISLGREMAGCIGFSAERLTNCSGEVFGTASENRSLTLIEGDGRLGRISSSRTLLAPVNLHHAAILLKSGGPGFRSAIGARVSKIVHRLDFGSWGASISGDDEKPLFASFDGKSNTATLIPALMHGLTLPVVGADLADVMVPGQKIDLLVGGDGEPAAKQLVKSSLRNQRNACKGLIIAHDNALAVVSLENSILTLRRSVDLFKLRFSFEGFELNVRGGVPSLRRVTRRSSPNPPPLDTIAVHFPPQHIAESYFAYQDPSTSPDPSFNAVPFSNSAKDQSDHNLGSRPLVTEARLSGESRLVFTPKDIVGQPRRWARRPLTVDALTDWSELELKANKRARPPNETIESQLSKFGIERTTSFDEAAQKVAQSFLPPEPRETALEMVGRLILSPAQGAGWITPRGKVDPRKAVLWHARLDEEGRKTVRALWSKWMLPGKFLRIQGKPGEPPQGEPPQQDRLLVLFPDDHWELIAQTSLYGMVALRGIEETAGAAATVDGTYLRAKPVAKASPPRSRVVRPSKDYVALEGPSSHAYAKDDLGFAVVEPFQDANLVMTSIGGSLGADWSGEPFTLPKAPGLLPPTFNLERFIYRSQLGRDVHVEVYDKGYLLPLGVRASYVELAERRFFPHPTLAYPVSYLVKRTFIVVRQPIKRMPAFGQPNGSRDFPATRIVMLTRQTPDLLNPRSSTLAKAPEGTGRFISKSMNPEDLVFWPRVTPGLPGTKGDVDFKWTLDEDHTPIVSNLLFVSNSCARNSRAMSEVAEYYRNLRGTGSAAGSENWSSLRRARVFGTRRRYAEPTPEAETAFDTDSWLLSITGLVDDPKNPVESFATTGALNQADQPPFFPVVQRAKIAIQTLDQLLGSPQGLVEVQFHAPYVANGFSTSRQPARIEARPTAAAATAAAPPLPAGNQPPPQPFDSEIFLEVLNPVIALNSSNNGSATGGIAHTNAHLAALSRKVGFVGGEPNDKTNTSSPDSSIGTPVCDFKDAIEGKFNPEKFFDIKSAKLFGFFPLAALIGTEPGGLPSGFDKAPRLLESTAYGNLLVDPQTLANQLRAPLKALMKSLQEIQKQCEKELKTIVGDGTAAITFDQLYPTLSAATRRLQELSGSTAIDITALYLTGRSLLEELGRLSNDPTPALAITAIQTLGKHWTDFNTVAGTALQPVQSQLRSSLSGILVGSLAGYAKDNSLETLIWSADGNSILSALLQDPILLALHKVEDASGIHGSLMDLSSALDASLDAMSAALRFATVVVDVSKTKSWPAHLGASSVLSQGYLVAVGSLSNLAAKNGTSPRQTIFSLATTLSTEIDHFRLISGERPDLVERLDVARNTVLGEVTALANATGALRAAADGLTERFKQGIDEVVKNAISNRSLSWTDMNAVLSQISEVSKNRFAALSIVQSLAVKLNLIASIVNDIPTASDARQILITQLTEVTKQLSTGVLLLSNLNAAGVNTPWKFRRGSEAWQHLTNDLSSSLNHLPSSDYVTRLKASLSGANQRAAGLVDLLSASNLTPAVLSAKIPEIAEYVEGFDHALVSMTLQPIAIDVKAAQKLSSAIVTNFSEVGKAADNIYGQLIQAVDDIKDGLNNIPILKLVINPQVLADLSVIRTELSAERKPFQSLRDAKDADSALTAVTSIGLSRQTLPTGSALRHAAGVLKDLVENALHGNLAGLFKLDFMQTFLRDATESARAIVAGLVPTSKDFNYTFATRFNGEGNQNGVVALSMDPVEGPHLTIDSKATIDLISGVRDVRVDGKIQPFTLSLKGFIDVKFSGARFSSQNGSAPNLAVQFKEIVLGPNLNFIKALQSFMSPDAGSGPYVLPTPEVIEAGYRYDAGLIQVGSLQFINVTLGVYAKLPLKSGSDGLPLRIGFKFGSADRPFLISQPPYGGGGYVDLALIDGKLEPTISLSFGAVASIHFGPLTGHGRITSTITCGKTADGAKLMRASVEAVGEGHLGCFGIAVMLQIALFQSGDDLWGTASYSFSFSVGFLKFSFSFVAAYRIAGGNGSSSKTASNPANPPAQPPGRAAVGTDGSGYRLQNVNWTPTEPAYFALAAASVPPTMPTADDKPCCTVKSKQVRRIRVIAPRKEVAWASYKQRFSMELLN